MTSKFKFSGSTSYVGGKTRWGTGEARFTNIRIFDSKGHEETTFHAGDEATIQLEIETYKKLISPTIWIALFNDDEVRIFGTYYNKDRVGEYNVEGRIKTECTIELANIQAGLYHIMVGIYGDLGNIAYDRIGRAASFTISKNNTEKFEDYNGYGANKGVVNLFHKWNVIK